MIRSFLRSSPLLAAACSWVKGSRFDITGGGHVIERNNARLVHTRIEISGRGCRLVIEPGARLWHCSLKLAGDGASLHIGADCRLRGTRLCSEDSGTRLVVGAGTSMTGPTLVAEEGRLLQIGRDCMIAQFAEIRNSDSHAILDDATGARLNPAADVIVGNHAWIGLGACVFKGASIGDGAIIAARALVTGTIPPGCIAAGLPARPVRNGIRWSRTR